MNNLPFEIDTIHPDASNSNIEAPRSFEKDRGLDCRGLIENRALDAKFEFSSKSGPGWVEFTLPMRTVTEANCFEHWTKKHKRHRIQQKSIGLILSPVKRQIKLPCHIELTRYAPKTLDKYDNLPMSFKYILDACCAIIKNDFRPGRADDDERFTVSYNQMKSKNYGIKITITNI
jgi:hypothetical protein